MVLATSAVAGTKRLAIVYGHNGGDGPRSALRYAEADAARMAKVFLEAGRVEPGNVKLLQGRPLAELFAALEWAKTEAKADKQTLLFVYLSAHATAEEGLLPGAEQVRWKELKRRITATGAKARVTIIDACQSSGVIETAAKEAPAFTIEAEDLLTVQGDAFITSSASTEPSLEAGQLRGSVFTQHLLAGLRGAADVTQDGQISLDEAYRFAYERTAAGESGQHPGLAVRLSGYGDIVVTRVREEGPGVVVPPGIERLVIRDPSTRDVVLSAVRPSAQRLLVPSGTWLVELEREGKRKEGRLAVPARGFGLVDEDQLTARAPTAGFIRLDANRPCPEITVKLPLPLLTDLKRRLEPTLRQLCTEHEVSNPTLGKDEQVIVLSLEVDSKPVTLRRSSAEQQQLAADLAQLKQH